MSLRQFSSLCEEYLSCAKSLSVVNSFYSSLVSVTNQTESNKTDTSFSLVDKIASQLAEIALVKNELHRIILSLRALVPIVVGQLAASFRYFGYHCVVTDIFALLETDFFAKTTIVEKLERNSVKFSLSKAEALVLISTIAVGSDLSKVKNLLALI
ncbi:hypothetical protein P9112_008592 [Eukaryota sp. TZLM1-RC]